MHESVKTVCLNDAQIRRKKKIARASREDTRSLGLSRSKGCNVTFASMDVTRIDFILSWDM